MQENNEQQKRHNGRVRLASLGRPRSAPVRSNSFDGAHPGQSYQKLCTKHYPIYIRSYGYGILLNAY